MEVKRIFDLLDRYKAEFPHKSDALAGKAGKQWKTYSTEAYIEYANLVSYGLLALGLKKGDKIATICNNRPEWNFIDMGMAQLGIIHVPLFTTLDSNGYREILQHAEVNLIFISSSVLYKKIASFETELESLKSIYTLDEVEGARNWLEVVETGRKEHERYQAEVEKIKKTISDTDVATLIYTSGTTGKSKGVLLTHRNLISTAKVAAGVFQLQPGQRYLSILPICHVGERMANYQTQYSGCSLYYTESLTTLGRDLQFVKPHGFGAVPRILEKVYEKIISKGRKLQGVKRKLFFWALGLAERFELDGANGIWYSLQLAVANKLIFSKWRDAMGGNVVAIGIGGAALQPRLERIFWAAGIKLLNMYGLTETSPIITINRQSGPDLHLGTVGSLVKGVEVKIAPDGEILCRGPNVMAGYYKDEEATRQAIDADGWFHTGDIGVLEDGFLKITDRKKELFKLSNGKYVSPLFIENTMKELAFIDQIMAVGEGEKFTSAIISPNFEALREWCSERGIDTTDKAGMLANPEVAALFKEAVAQGNKKMPKDEQVKKFRLVPEEWTVESGELSPTLKLKRRVLREKYQTLIGEIFRQATTQETR